LNEYWMLNDSGHTNCIDVAKFASITTEVTMQSMSIVKEF